MEFIKKIIKFLTNICYVLILIYAVVEIPMIFGYKPLIVLSGSMEPTYKIGSILYYKDVVKEELKVGDVITFQLTDGTYITHRINRIVENKYETKGDANELPDVFKIDFKDVCGKVSSISIGYVGYYINFINNHIYLVGVAVLILLSEFLLSNVRIFDIKKRGKE